MKLEELVKLFLTHRSWAWLKLGQEDLRIVCHSNRTNRYVDMTGVTNVFEDLNFSIATLNPTGAPSPATFRWNSGQAGNQMALEYVNGNTLYIAAQTQHYWVPGTTVYPHIHVQPQTANANNITWTLNYEIADINSGFVAGAPIVNFATNIAAGNQWKHMLLAMPSTGINMTGYLGPSTVLRLYYIVTAMTVGEVLHVLGFDVHIRYGGTPVVYTPP